MLQGPRLSRVQEFAVELMLISEERQKSESFVERFKLAVVSNDPAFWIDRVFPKWKSSSPQPGVVHTDEIEDLDAELADTTGEWRFEEMSPREAEKLMAELMAHEKHGSVSATELDGGWV